MKSLIMKFGGASVGTTTALTQVISIILHETARWQRLIVVVSALDGVTDQLIEAARLAQLSNRRGYRRITATLRTRHLALIEKLPLSSTERSALQADVDRLLFDMLNLCEQIAHDTSGPATPETLDAVIGVGERLAARIVSALLRHNAVRSVAYDTMDLIVTNDVFGNATPNMDLTRERVQANLLPMLDRRIIPVLTGFIGGTPDGKPTTLGRGGSDYSASILAVCAGADEVWMWTTVDGIMSTDPLEVPEACVISELSYHEMADLAYFGARILHTRMVGLLRANTIPLHVKNVFKPQHPGTVISAHPAERPELKAVTHIQGIALMSEQVGGLTEILSVMDEVMQSTIGENAGLTLSSQGLAHSFLCFLIPTSAGIDAPHTLLAALEQRLTAPPPLSQWNFFQVSILTVVGGSTINAANRIAEVTGVLEGIRLYGITHGKCSLSFVVPPEQSQKALYQLHALTLC